MRLATSLTVAAVLGRSAMAAKLYEAPTRLKALIDSDECDNSDLPDDFHVVSFMGHSLSEDGEELKSFEFSYLEDSNNVITRCHFNETSENLADEGLAPRYACEKKQVHFIYQPGKISIIEGVCPEADGSAPYEASGGALVFLDCESASSCGSQGFWCAANETDILGTFSSVHPTSISGGSESPDGESPDVLS